MLKKVIRKLKGYIGIAFIIFTSSFQLKLKYRQVTN